jgi:hypothetical protein
MRPALTISIRHIRDDLQIPVRGKRTQDRRSQGSSKVCRGNKSRFGSGKRRSQHRPSRSLTRFPALFEHDDVVGTVSMRKELNAR